MTRSSEGKNRRRDFLRNLRRFEFSNLRLFYGVKMGFFMMTLLAIGIVFNREVIFATLGTLFIASTSMSVLEEQRSKRSKINTLIVISGVNASTFTIGTIVATTGFLVVPLCALGLFIISYAGVFPNSASIVFIACLTFSVGIGQSSGGIIAMGERFLLVIAGGLWGILGSIIPTPHSISKPKAEAEYVSVRPPHPQVTHREWLKPLASNLSLRSEFFRFALTFAITGAIGLLIAIDLGLQKQYWVLITICIIFLRASISTIFSFTSMRIIGTIFGAAIASAITAYVNIPGLLLSFVFPFATMHLAASRVNYILATLLLTTFMLVLLNILSPGQTLLAQTRILDTIIGAALTLARVSFFRSSLIGRDPEYFLFSTLLFRLSFHCTFVSKHNIYSFNFFVVYRERR